MATWKELADGNWRAAKSLRREGEYRSSISRAYYAAYCYYTGELIEKYGSQFRNGQNNPSHDQLLKLVAHNLHVGVLADDRRRKIKKRLEILRNMRVDADYVPTCTIEQKDAIAALSLVEGIFRER